MPATKRYHQRSFQTYMGTPRGFIIPNAIKSVNYRLLKLGYYGLTLRSMELLGQLAKAGLYNDNLVQHYMAFNGVQQSSNAVSSWLNLAPSRISLNKNLTQATAANMPTWLRHTAAEGNYGYLPGTAGNYFSTPDAAPLRITGDIDIRCNVALPSWTPVADSSLISKYTGAASLSYRLLVNSFSGGTIRLNISVDGAVAMAASSSIAPGFIANSTNWIRATWRQSDGRVQFFTSTDGTTWMQLGTNQSIAVASIFSGNAVVEIGSSTNGVTQVTNGRFYRAQIYSGIPISEGGAGQTLAFDFNPATYVSGTTFLDSSSNAATITLNGGATVVTASALYFDGVNDFLKTGPFTLAQPETVYLVGKQMTWTSNEKFFDGNSTTERMSLIQTSGGASPQLSAFAGGTIGPNSSLALQTVGIITTIFNGTSSSLRVNIGVAVTGDTGAQNGGGITVGADFGGNAQANVAIQELLVFNQIHSPAQTSVILGYLNEKYNLGL